LDQRRAPYFEGLLKYINQGRTAFHMPGHNRGKGVHPLLKDFLGENVFLLDLTEVEGVDYLHKATGILKEAQDLLSDLYGSTESFFLINGSTGGNHAMIFSTVGDGEKIILGRNSHRSALGGLIVSGAVPVYVPVEVNSRIGVTTNLDPGKLEETIKNNTDAKAVFITTPNYYGMTGNVKLYADIAHKYNMPLLVDEAHGAHYGMHPELPETAVRQGADLVVQSAHKTLASMTQTSWIHYNDNGFIDLARLKMALQVLQSTSPNYVLLSSLDVARMQLATEGKIIYDRVLDVARYLRKTLNEIPGIFVIGKEVEETDPFVSVYDETKIVISFEGKWEYNKGRMYGYIAEKILNHEYNIEVELSDPHNVLAFITVGHYMDDAKVLVDAIKDMSKKYYKGEETRGVDYHILPHIPEVVLTPREAFFAKSEMVAFDENVIGRVCAEVVSLYPPGIPIVAPGERIDREIYEFIKERITQGAEVQGPIDPELNYIKVIK